VEIQDPLVLNGLLVAVVVEELVLLDQVVVLVDLTLVVVRVLLDSNPDKTE